MQIKIALFLLIYFTAINAWSNSTKEIRIVTEHWPPYSYINENGEVDGMATILIKKIMKEAGLDYSIELLSWKRAYKSAKENKDTLLYTIYKLENRESDFQWLCPLINTKGVKIYALASRNDVAINNIDDAKKYSTGVISTGWTHDYLKSEGFETTSHLDIGSSELTNIKKLLAGRIDLVVQEEDLIELRLKKLNKTSNVLKPVFTLISNQHKEGCMAMSLDTSKATINRISAALLKVNSSANQLINKENY